MILTERSFRSKPQTEEISPLNDILGYTINENGDVVRSPYRSDNMQALEKRRLHYDGLIDYMKSKGATTNVDGIEILDINKAYEVLMEQPDVKKYVESVQGILSDMVGMAEVNSYINGRQFVFEDKYFPLQHVMGDREIDVNSIAEAVKTSSDMRAKLTSKSTVERTNAVGEFNFNTNEVMTKYISEMARNYHVYPEARKAMMAFMEAGKEAQKNELAEVGGSKANIDMFTKAMIASVKKRMDRAYRVGQFRNTAARRVTAKLNTAAMKSALLQTIIPRIPSEYLSNSVRAMVSTMDVPTALFSKYKDNRDVYDQLISEYIGTRYMSHWENDIHGRISKKSSLAGRGEDIADRAITFSDNQVGRPLYAYEFEKAFSRISGEEFDPVRYNTDLEYRVKYGDAVDQAGFRALRKVEELFNAKTNLTPALRYRILGIKNSMNADSYLGKSFNFLMSYNQNEKNQMLDSYRRWRYSPFAEDKAQARRDIMAVTISNFLYTSTRQMLSFAVANLVSSAFGLNDQKMKDKLDKVYDLKYQRDQFALSIGTLMAGRNVVFLNEIYKIGLLFTDIADIGSKETKDQIAQMMEYNMFVNRIPENGRWDAVLSSALSPLVPGKIVQDFSSFALAIGDASSQFQLGNNKYAAARATEAAFTLINYLMINPLTPMLTRFDQQFERDLKDKLDRTIIMPNGERKLIDTKQKGLKPISQNIGGSLEQHLIENYTGKTYREALEDMTAQTLKNTDDKQLDDEIELLKSLNKIIGSIKSGKEEVA